MEPRQLGGSTSEANSGPSATSSSRASSSSSSSSRAKPHKKEERDDPKRANPKPERRGEEPNGDETPKMEKSAIRVQEIQLQGGTREEAREVKTSTPTTRENLTLAASGKTMDTQHVRATYAAGANAGTQIKEGDMITERDSAILERSSCKLIVVYAELHDIVDLTRDPERDSRRGRKIDSCQPRASSTSAG
jgi:hypothetical protein